MIVAPEKRSENFKTIRIYKNAQHNNLNNHHHDYFEILLFHNITIIYIRKQLNRFFKFPLDISTLKLFTKKGVEVFESDLQYLSNGEILYASQGEEFDSSVEFKQYKQLKVIGQGGFGKVILAQHRKTRQKVALKYINTNFIENARDIDMVFREMETVKSFDNPGIVKIYDCFYIPPMQVVLAMEYLEGGELRNFLISKGKLDENEAREIFVQIANTVNYCHRNKLIHRDLKLENVVFEKSDSKKIKLIDFGIAMGSKDIDIDRVEVGSLMYMAPEVLQKQFKQIGTPLDVWSMGCILYCLIFGKLPFNGTCSEDIQYNICFQNIILPFDVNISINLRRLILGMLNRDTNQRLTSSQIIQHPWVTGEECSLIIKQQQMLLLIPKLVNKKNNINFLQNLQEEEEEYELVSQKENLDQEELQKKNDKQKFEEPQQKEIEIEINNQKLDNTIQENKNENNLSKNDKQNVKCSNNLIKIIKFQKQQNILQSSRLLIKNNQDQKQDKIEKLIDNKKSIFLNNYYQNSNTSLQFKPCTLQGNLKKIQVYKNYFNGIKNPVQSRSLSPQPRKNLLPIIKRVKHKVIECE